MIIGDIDNSCIAWPSSCISSVISLIKTYTIYKLVHCNKVFLFQLQIEKTVL
jgi:hypothetical protein